MISRKLNKILAFLVPWLLLTCNWAVAQEMNLGWLYNDWAIDYEVSSDSIVNLKASNSNGFSKLKNRSDIYRFSNLKDSIVYENAMNIKQGWWCGSELSPVAKEIWSFNYSKKLLRYDIYENENCEVPLYSELYEIKSIDKKHLKLHLKKELYAGIE